MEEEWRGCFFMSERSSDMSHEKVGNAGVVGEIGRRHWALPFCRASGLLGADRSVGFAVSRGQMPIDLPQSRPRKARKSDLCARQEPEERRGIKCRVDKSHSVPVMQNGALDTFPSTTLHHPPLYRH
jgi:hypothetical protein